MGGLHCSGEETKMNALVEFLKALSLPEETITVSEYFDRCIEYIRQNALPINEKFFMELKAAAEKEIEKWSKKRFYSVKSILLKNRVERTESGLVVMYGKEIKFKDKIFELYFPSEFNENFIIIKGEL